MADGPKGGMVSVLDQLRPHESEAEAGAEQVDLLGMRELPAMDVVRGRGRPPGARNRRTQAWADYILARHASPLEVLAQIAVASVHELSVKLGCTALEALQEKRHAATALAPYLHQRQPLAVDLTNNRVVHLTIYDHAQEGEVVEGESVTIETLSEDNTDAV